ncbi:MAG: ice-binding family protein [Verrucomicrobia bacterium]|nr:ice-binding family protein [Verrucomicrobiota bacterium]
MLALTLAAGASLRAQTILGSTGGYAVMAGSTVTANGVNTFTGDLAAASLAGAGSVSFGSTGASVGPPTAQNQTDFTRAYTGLAAMPGAVDLSGQVLGSGGVVSTLPPGVYKFASTAQLTGTLTLDAQGQSNAVWVFQIGSTLDTAANSKVVFAHLVGDSVTNDGLFWQVGTTTVFGSNTSFEGNLLGGTTLDFGSGATINHGRALTGSGQTITFAGNAIDFGSASSGYSGGLEFAGDGISLAAIPEPSTYGLIAGAIALGIAGVRRRFAAARRPGPS